MATELPTEAQLVAQLETSKLAIPVFKQGLEACRENLEARFHAGEDVEALIEGRAQFVDMVLRLAWTRFDWNENLGKWFKTRISLVAVGGYGRGELHPHSDIDLLILLERNSYQRHASNIQSFLTLLWDIGLEVGHSVRSISECKTQARQDVTVMTAMLEGRTIVGSVELFDRVRQLTGPGKMWSHQAFYAAKLEEQQARHTKFEHIEYSLEPNVKTSPGGLRDIQTVMWITKRWMNLGDTRVDFDTLVEYEFLTPQERDILRAGERLLWKIRFGLHLINGRDEDRLLFDYQRQLADMFGYEDGDQLAVEQFMQDYYRMAMVISTTGELLLQLFNEEIIQGKNRAQIEPINERFQFRNNYIEACNDQVFKDHPPALMEIFLLIGANPDCPGTTAATVRLIRQHLYLIDDDFRCNPQVTEMFIELLSTSEVLASQLRRMERYGVLGAYLPEFGRIIGQMQFDLFHIYTVDAHTLQVVRNMRRFRYRDQEQKFPVAAHIYPRLPKVELLFIAGLYHDIAKGMGGDHSELGIGIARDFCQRHNLKAWDTNLVCWLVENHLIMSSTAQRKDISDPEVINEFASIVKDQVRLDYLYTLTVADINATNPTLWNGWRASLMRQLYNETKKLLRHGLEDKVDTDEYIAEIQEHAIGRLEESGISKSRVMEIWGDVDEEYFLRESVPDIVRHTAAIDEHDASEGQPLVLIEDTVTRRENEGATQIFIYTENRDYVFASMVTAFDLAGLDIVDARIARNTDYSFDTFMVLEANGRPVGPLKNRQEQIRKLVIQHLSVDRASEPKEVNRTPRLLKPFAFKTDVRTSIDPIKNLTVLEVQTPDRPGLLSIVANIFVDLEVHVVSAKITTLGDRVEDLFYLSDKEGEPLSDTDQLRERICQELDQHIESESA
ncbi:MAG: [protein-PII] uridylyltransferase [Pseudomonadales bacterium]